MCHRFIDTETDRAFNLTVWPIVSIQVIFLRFALTVWSVGNFKCSEHAVSYLHQPLQHWRNRKLIADTLIGTDSQRFTPLLELAAILNLEATANKLLNFSRVVTWQKFGVSSTLQEWAGRFINQSPNDFRVHRLKMIQASHPVAPGSECLEKWRHHGAQRCDPNWKNGSRHREAAKKSRGN